MPSLSFSTKQELGWHLHCLDRAERLVSQWYSGSTFYFNIESFFTIYLQKCFNSQRSSLIFPDSRLFQEWSFQSIFWTCHGKTGHYPREELAGEDCVFQCFFPLRYCYDCIFLPISTGGLKAQVSRKSKLLIMKVSCIGIGSIVMQLWCLAISVIYQACFSIIVIPVKRQSQTWLCRVDMFRKFHHCYSCLTSSCLTHSENSIIVIPIKRRSQAWLHLWQE